MHCETLRNKYLLRIFIKKYYETKIFKFYNAKRI